MNICSSNIIRGDRVILIDDVCDLKKGTICTFLKKNRIWVKIELDGIELIVGTSNVMKLSDWRNKVIKNIL